jgi:hypothetical protein
MTFLKIDIRLWLRRSGIFLLSLILLYAIGRPTQMWLDGFYSGARAPYLQMPAATAMSIRWQSTEKYRGVIHYGIDANQLDLVQTETSPNTEHEIRISGLQPATRYFYSAGNKADAEYKGPQFWFRTSPVTGTAIDHFKPVRFWVTGDQGDRNKVQTQVRDTALSWVKQHPRKGPNPSGFDFWLTTGDNAYRSGTNPQFQAEFFDPYKAILRNTPVWPTYGNHDARRWVFFNIFTFPEHAESGGVASGTEHYYSFNYENIHFIFLDTVEGDLDPQGKMLKWLARDLKQTRQQWLIAVSHHPPYTKGSHDSDSPKDSGGRLIKIRKNILPILEKAGLDLYLSGHSHMYERSDLMGCNYGLSKSFNEKMVLSKAKNSVYVKQDNLLSANNGTVYTVLGSSSKVDDGPLNHPAMPHSLHEAGSMVIDVDKNNLQAYFINNEGKVADQFTIRKGVKGGAVSHACK